MIDLVVDQRDLIGLVLSMSRVGAFVTASPMMSVLPIPGRLAFTLAVGLALSEPALADASLSGLVAAQASTSGSGWSSDS